MHDIKFIREHPEAFDAGLARRGLAAQAVAVLELDAERRANETMQQNELAKRNSLSKAIGQAMAMGDKGRAEQLKEDAALAKSFEATGQELAQKRGEELRALLASLPNLPDAEVPEIGRASCRERV